MFQSCLYAVRLCFFTFQSQESWLLVSSLYSKLNISWLLLCCLSGINIPI